MAYLSVENLEKAFGGTRVLRDVSFQLPEGETLSVIGSSGSGKTTLLRCLNFLERPDGGVISLRGEPLLDASRPPDRERDLRRKRLHFGLVFQDFNLFPQYTALETVCLLSKLHAKQHIEIDLSMDELDLTAAESKATYDEIKAYVLEKYGLKVSSLYISQVKRKCGLDVGQNYNLPKKEDAKVPQCPPEKEAAIIEALKHFQMIS